MQTKNYAGPFDLYSKVAAKIPVPKPISSKEEDVPAEGGLDDYQ